MAHLRSQRLWREYITTILAASATATHQRASTHRELIEEYATNAIRAEWLLSLGRLSAEDDELFRFADDDLYRISLAIAGLQNFLDTAAGYVDEDARRLKTPSLYSIRFEIDPGSRLVDALRCPTPRHTLMTSWTVLAGRMRDGSRRLDHLTGGDTAARVVLTSPTLTTDSVRKALGL
jgi:hypothetical protein